MAARNAKKVVGLTGGIACGKSTVAAIFSEFDDVEVFDTDKLAKEIAAEKAEELNRLLETNLFSNLAANKERIAELIFSNPLKKKRLEEWLSPIVWSRIEAKIDRSEKKIFVVESALIYEAGIENRFNCVIAVICPQDEQIRRMKSIRGMSNAAIEARLRNQFDPELKTERARFVIQTACPIKDLRAQAEAIYKRLKEG